MLYFTNFSNYEEFKELFGVRVCGNGEKSRRNKILLALMKDKNFVKMFRETTWRYLDNRKKEEYIRSMRKLTTMTTMRDFILERITTENVPIEVINGNVDNYWHFFLMDSCYYDFMSTKYDLDDGGICWDGDFKSIRYRNIESDHVYKMKAGKFLRHLLEENPFGHILPEQVKVWLCEDFAERWQAYAQSKSPSATLHIGSDMDDFETIYDGSRYDGNFGSCMASESQYSFYYDAVDAKAAWLENGNGAIVARCVIFTEVYDEDGKKWRLAERQYSSGGLNGLKRLLVDKLIEAGEIDGYKAVGVDCHSARSFVANDGTSLEDKHFHIECRLEPGDTLSYQDSFKYFDYNEQIAYNRSSDCCNYDDLATTDSEYGGSGCWSDYNETYIREEDAYYDEERGDYFYRHQVRLCENTNDYHFEDDCVELASGGYAFYGRNCEGYDDVYYCEECGQYFLDDDGYFSDITGEGYCSEECMEEAEQRYMRLHKDDGRFAYDEVDEMWYQVEDFPKAVRVLVWDWMKNKRRNALTRLENRNNRGVFQYGKNWYYGNASWNNDKCVYEPREKVIAW